MDSLSRFVLRHRRAVGAFWAAMLVAGAVATGGVSDRLTKDFSVPGVASYETNEAIRLAHGNGGGGFPDVPVITLPRGMAVTSPDVSRALARAFAAIERDDRLRVASYRAPATRGSSPAMAARPSRWCTSRFAASWPSRWT
jgi:RND superfamily putative drug exporter